MEIVDKLVAEGILRRCRQCGKVLTREHHNRRFCDVVCKREWDKYHYERKRVAMDNWWFHRGRDQGIILRELDNARRLMEYIGGKSKDGGDRKWFRMGDIEASGCCEQWLFGGKGRGRNSRRWREMMRRLEKAGLIEVRKALDGSAGNKGKRSYNEYRFLRWDEEFMQGEEE